MNHGMRLDDPEQDPSALGDEIPEESLDAVAGGDGHDMF